MKYRVTARTTVIPMALNSAASHRGRKVPSEGRKKKEGKSNNGKMMIDGLMSNSFVNGNLGIILQYTNTCCYAAPSALTSAAAAAVCSWPSLLHTNVYTVYQSSNELRIGLSKPIQMYIHVLDFLFFVRAGCHNEWKHTTDTYESCKSDSVITVQQVVVDCCCS